ncbi:DNA gyrase inhibitor YacG [Hyphococcus luteus]|uniref:DNA gyrase inhibitor YacG n=1 Tax=Hyphococcus luteus TaxID=2058213 RepID=UPI001A9C445A|nr:DNA gyrase inhibitor YacG [Marinicaulis flavus]
MTSPSNDNQGLKGERCPICKKPAVAGYEPFCSKRCADVDLHRWLTGGYAIPAQEDDSDGVTDEGGEPPQDS